MFKSHASYKTGGIFIMSLAMPLMVSAAGFHTYEEVRLVSSDVDFNADHLDSRLINPWGLTFGQDGHLIVADNDSSVLATSYRANGSLLPFTIADPDGFHPTGLESNHSSHDFLIHPKHDHDKHAKAAELLFATEDGVILAYNREIDHHDAQVVIDRTAEGAVYKGLALGIPEDEVHQWIFAADFHNGLVDVFDHEFHYVKSFTDSSLPEGYAPFNVQNFGGLLYVSFALQNPPENHDDLAGPGHGFVDIFSTDGLLIKRLISQGALNSPWGLAIAPSDFGRLSGALLVGNFGDGRINAYDPGDGTFLGSVTNDLNEPIEIEGLWSIKFGPQSERSEDDAGRDGCARLYFTAGPDEEGEGLLGVIVPNRSEALLLSGQSLEVAKLYY